MHPDHRVLDAGGIDATGVASNSVETLDNGHFVSIAPMASARAYHAATLQSAGTVLVTGGFDNSGAVLAKAEVFSPPSGWRPVGDMHAARIGHTATWFRSGTIEGVLVAGGGDNAHNGLESAEIFDGVSNFNLTSGSPSGPATTMHDYRMFAAASVLTDGRVLITGGYDAQSRNLNHQPAASSAEIFDPSSGQFAYTASPMKSARVGHTATLLQNGMVLIAGGRDQNNNDPNPFAEIYDPSPGCNNFTALPATAAMPAVTGHSATAMTCPTGLSFTIPGC